MKRLLKFLVMLMSLVLVCSTVAQARSNEELFAAVRYGNAQEVRRVLAAGADVNGRDDERGATPLFWAALSGSAYKAELLIASGADLNAKDQKGLTPLHAAAYQSRKEVVQLLVQRGADVNAKSTAGWTPLHKAMEKLANPETTHLVSPSDVEAMVSIVELLLAKGADINAKAASGDTPLNFATVTGQKALVEMLLAKEADINVKGYEDVTPLYVATQLKRAEVAELLLARGAEVNARTKNGYTPLIMASRYGNKDIVELLIVHGADINVKDNDGKTPLLWALSTAWLFSPSWQAQFSAEERQKAQKAIRKLKAEWWEVSMLLIAHGANTNAIASNNDSPLGIAVYLDDKNLVEALIDHGADINYVGAKETALHAAIAEKHRDVVKLLIIKGANVNALNMSNRTPLHFLAKFIDDRKLAELMIEHGANINAKDKNGDTPLAFANNAQNNQVVKVLREHGGK